MRPPPAGWSRPRASGCGSCRSTPTSTAPPTTSSATPPSGSCTTASTSWPAGPASTPASARRGRPTARSTGPSPTSSPSRPPRARPCWCRTTTSPSWRRSSPSRRPDLRLVHFSHTPFADPDVLAGAPASTSAASCSPAWPPTTPAASTPTAGPTASPPAAPSSSAQAPTTFVAPLGPDAADIGRVAAGDGLRRRPRRARRAPSATAPLLVRVDRIELSKNILRGFLAFDDLLERYPEWRERVVFGAFVYPSREGLPEYLAYRQEVEATVRAHQRALGHRRTGRPILLRPLRRLPPLGRRPAPGRRAPRQPDPRRAQPRRRGGAARQRARRRPRCSPPRPACGTSSAAPPGRCTPTTSAAPPTPCVAALDRHARGTGRRGRRAAAPGRAPAPPRTGWPTSSPPPTEPADGPALGRSAGEAGAEGLQRAPSASAGPSTVRSAAAASSGASSSERDHDLRDRATPSARRRSRAANAGRSPTSSPRKHTASSPSASPVTTVPLSMATGGCSSIDILAGAQLEPGAGGLALGPGPHGVGGLGVLAVVQGDRQALVLDEHARRGRRLPAAATTSSTASRQAPAVGIVAALAVDHRLRGRRGPTARPASRRSGAGGTRPAGPRSPPRGPTGRRGPRARRPPRRAGAAAAGSSTIGDRVPSKSVNTPDRPGSATNASKAAGSGPAAAPRSLTSLEVGAGEHQDGGVAEGHRRRRGHRLHGIDRRGRGPWPRPGRRPGPPRRTGPGCW